MLWKKAIEEELSVIKATGTWELVDIPQGVNIVSSIWVFEPKNMPLIRVPGNDREYM